MDSISPTVRFVSTPRSRGARAPGRPEVEGELTPHPERTSPGRGTWRVEMLTSAEELDALAPAWTELFHASGTRNPFAHPAWQRTWASHFVAPGNLRVLAVWSGNDLVAVGPFYRSSRGVGGARVSRLRLIGGSNADVLTELVEVIALPAARRKALRLMLEHLHVASPDWDWIELGISPDQAWLEPDIVNRSHGTSVVHFYSDAAVVVPLPGTQEQLHAQMKRNVTESLRRSRNRLSRDGHAWTVSEMTHGAGLDEALGELRRLHHARAEMNVRVKHPDRMRTPELEQFVRNAVSRMADDGSASVHVLEVDGAPAASVLALRANDCTFISLSGYEQRWWEYGVMTLLTLEVLNSAVERGHRWVDLSLGPDNSKLRWSEQIAVHPYFAIVRRSARARLSFRAFLHARAQLPRVLDNPPDPFYAGRSAPEA